MTVITGMGVLAPNGLGVGPFWSSTLAGRNGIGPVTRFDTGGYPVTLAGEVPGFVPERHLASRLLPQTDHMTRMALVAADWALADAGIEPSALPDFAAGVVTASSSGGFEFGHRELEALWSKGSEHVSAYQSFAWFYAVNTGQISIRHGLRGPGGVVVSEQAGGLDVLAMARRRLRDGVGVMLSGGVDSALCPWGWVAQIASRRLSPSTDPDRAYLPFDAAASGFVPGEGGAILVVETAEHARARGARPYGEIAGYAATFDPPPDSGRPSNLTRAIEQALAEADVEPSDVDVVLADAAGVPALDLVEARAIAAVFGPGGVPVTAPKTATGRLYSGGGSLDVVTALLAIRDGVIPPTPNVSQLAPGIDIDLVCDRPRAVPVRTALVVARGYGGYNSAVVLRAATDRFEEDQ